MSLKSAIPKRPLHRVKLESLRPNHSLYPTPLQSYRPSSSPTSHQTTRQEVPKSWSRPANLPARCSSPPGKRLALVASGPAGLGTGAFSPPKQARRLTFNTGASGIGKGRVGPQLFAEGESGEGGKVVRVGEDAYFEGPRRDALGVGDGVGGWANTNAPGANAGRFSALLMSAISEQVEHETSLSSGPVEIMQAGFERCMAQASIEGLQGSSTALLALLRSAGEQDFLRVANVGDSFLGVIRQVGPYLRRQIVFQTQEQQHHFNCPYQLGTNKLSSVPKTDALDYTFPVERGDIVILCSDGLVDNLFEDEIISVIEEAPSPLSPQILSDRLCARAKMASEMKMGMRPFGEKAALAGKSFSGGKVDDISVLVAIIGGPDLSSPPP